MSYYVQQMFAMNKGTNVLSLTMPDAKNKKGVPVAGQEGQDGLFASSVWDAATGEVVVKVVNTSKQPQMVQLNLLGMKNAGEVKTLTLATNGSLDDENTLDQPEKIIPRPGKTQTVADKKAVVLTDELPAMAFRLYRIKK